VDESKAKDMSGSLSLHMITSALKICVITITDKYRYPENENNVVLS
jgi:hypothetical protein